MFENVYVVPTVVTERERDLRGAKLKVEELPMSTGTDVYKSQARAEVDRVVKYIEHGLTNVVLSYDNPQMREAVAEAISQLSEDQRAHITLVDSQ